MRKKISFLLLALCISFHLVCAQEGKIEIAADVQSDKSVEFNFTKSDPGTFTVQTKFKTLSNASESGSTYQARGYSGVLLTLQPINKEQSVSYSYSYRCIRGKLLPKVNFEFIYALPHNDNVEVHVGEASYLSAKYFGNVEPKDWKSYYLYTEAEESVLASRKGLVVEVIDGNEDFTDDVTFKSKNNKIIIEHEDGTLASYGALKNGSIKVKAGDTVFPKDELAKNSKRGDQRYSFAFSIMYLKAADLFVNEGKNISNDQSLYGFVTPKFLTATGGVILDNHSKHPAVWNEEVIVKEMSKKELKKHKKN
ncbi:M23 family metallopeptidase [Sphingobacterium bovistauri]|uniref:Peptidase family M23 n=1 Tax=Sphingobacterium bovistauri TaxID=2781959 RepID=A0ABS7Z7E4_9SPHI|nr:M23 family metallopeptidase [Sphingobacterium bovistauri]MCA5005472.1 hypothetical protein [Sphingobacterium bovistauri]